MNKLCFSAVCLATLAPVCLASPSARPSDHAPIGIMADHRHATGEWMLSYRYMPMLMQRNLIGTQAVSPEQIVTSIDNAFAPPATLRVVPIRMDMHMHMFGLMYAPHDRITLTAMTMITHQSMAHITFSGGSGTDQLDRFTTRSSGFGDTSLGAIIGLEPESWQRAKLNLSVRFSFPSGSLTRTGQILTPAGGTPSPRLPYPMQLGSGSVDFTPALTANIKGPYRLHYGGQISGIIRLHDNHEGYRLGDQATLNVWGGWEASDWLSLSTRLATRFAGNIRGMDPAIALPVQTADPANYGGTQVFLYGGLNLLGPAGAWHGHRLALELGGPVWQHLNGPQLAQIFTATLGWQKAF